MLPKLIIMKQIAYNAFFQNSLTTIIAPHGVTDIVHATSRNKIHSLIFTYTGTFFLGEVFHYCNLPQVNNALFLIASIIHFRHDIRSIVPKQYENLSFLGSTGLVYAFSQDPLIAFFSYMLLVHVPNHYRMAWGYLQNKLPQTLLLLFVTSIVSQYLFSLKLDDHFIQMMMSIVIGHVVYEEKEIHS